MRAPLSIIIPTSNSANHLPLCLGSLGEGLRAGIIRELIFVDAGSDDATLTIAEAAGAEVISAPSQQLAKGAEVAQGQWFLFLAASTQLGDGWTEAVIEAFRAPGAYQFTLQADQRGLRGRCASAWKSIRRRLVTGPDAHQGLVIDRASYLASGGFVEAQQNGSATLRLASRTKPKTLAAQAILT